MKQSTHILAGPRSIAAALAYILVMGASGQDYTIYDLGTLGDPEVGGATYGSGALAVNDIGEVTGWRNGEFNVAHAFLWLPNAITGQDEGMRSLGHLETALPSFGYGIGTDDDPVTVVGEAWISTECSVDVPRGFTWTRLRRPGGAGGVHPGRHGRLRPIPDPRAARQAPPPTPSRSRCTMTKRTAWISGMTVALLACAPTRADLHEFAGDRDGWLTAAHGAATIGFAEFPDGTLIAEQYADEHGVHFVDGMDEVSCCSRTLFPRDGSGLDGFAVIKLKFDVPCLAIAIDHPDTLRIGVFRRGLLIGTTTTLGGPGTGYFSGLVSSAAFDEVRIYDNDGFVAIDDLHLGPPTASAALLELEDDRAGWFAAVEEVVTIGFTGFPSGTRIEEQYADLGVHFVDGDSYVVCCGWDTFPQDAAGLDGNEEILLEFDDPMTAIAADSPGFVVWELFRGGELVASSTDHGHSGVGNFGGVILDSGFDAVRIWHPLGNVTLDDLHFGSAVDSPGLTCFDGDRPGWETEVQAHSSANFVGLPVGPFEQDVYAHVGLQIVVPPGSSYGVTCCNVEQFNRDGAGINGEGPLELRFDRAVHGLALDFNGSYFATVFRGSAELGTTPQFGSGGHGNYAGFTSSIAFDRVVLSEFGAEPTLSIDDIHFGPPIMPGDTTGDGLVDVADLLDLLTHWGSCIGCIQDLDGNGSVGTNDLLLLVAYWSA